MTNKKRKVENKRQEITFIFKEWSLSSTCHCYPKIFRNIHLPVRVLWSCFFIVFVSFTFTLISRSIHDFLEYDVVSKIRVFNEKLSPFPTVTICNANPFNTKEAEDLIKHRETRKETDEQKKIEMGLINMEMYKNIIMEKSFNLSDVQKQKLGFAHHQIQSCYFNEIECSVEDFNWVHSYMWGSCLQFNSPKNKSFPLKQTKLGGRNYGIY